MNTITVNRTNDPTTTTTYPCPEPDAPFCGWTCEEMQTCDDVVVVVPDSDPATPTPMTELPVTGFNGISLLLVLLAGVLIAVGTDLVRRGNRL